MNSFLKGISRLSLGLGILVFSSAYTHAQSKVNFLPTANSSDYITPVGGDGSFSLGVYVESTFPISSAFSTYDSNGKQTNLRYQVPVAFGFELAYGLSKHFELGLGVGYDSFEARQLVRETGTTKVYNDLRYRFIPIVGLLRYRWSAGKRWSPEIELGAGASMGSITVSQTTNSSTNDKVNKTYLRGHLAAGAGYAWATDFSLHFQLGYGVQKLGEEAYDVQSPDGIVEQKSLFHGVFAKGFVRYYF